MYRLTTEEPSGNMHNMWNIVFVKDKEVYLRGLAENGEDISLVDYCKAEYKRLYGEDIDASVEEFGEYMDDDTLLSRFYCACVGFAETREKLKAYEDTGKEPQEIDKTGLIDRNGIEIKAGDTVKRTAMAPGGKDFIGKVVYSQCAFWLDNGTETILLWTEIDLMEVLKV